MDKTKLLLQDIEGAIRSRVPQENTLLEIFQHSCFDQLAQRQPAYPVSLLTRLTGMRLSPTLTEAVKGTLRRHSLFSRRGPSPQILVLDSDQSGVLLPKGLLARQCVKYRDRLVRSLWVTYSQAKDLLSVAGVILKGETYAKRLTWTEALHVAAFGSDYAFPMVERLGAQRLIELIDSQSKEKAKLQELLKQTCSRRIWSVSLTLLAALNPGVGFGRRGRELLITGSLQETGSLQPEGVEELLTQLCPTHQKCDKRSSPEKSQEEWYVIPSEEFLKEYSVVEKSLTEKSSFPAIDQMFGKIRKKVVNISVTVTAVLTIVPMHLAFFAKTLFWRTGLIEDYTWGIRKVGLPVMVGVATIFGTPVAAVYGGYRALDLVGRLGYHTYRKWTTPKQTLINVKQDSRPS